MLRFLILLACLGTFIGASFPRITSYAEYLDQWKQQVPPEHIHNVTHIATHRQLCKGGVKCPFFYYSQIDHNLTDPIRNRSVLLVGGMHGNQYLGPLALLNGYKHFNAANVIYFPLVNPSGFDLNKRQTYPTNRDPNRDYPVDGVTDCYQTNAALIMDYLFRQYNFDLVLVLHDGKNQIGFNWGTVEHLKNSHTVDYDIQLGMGQLMKRAGGDNSKLWMTEFSVGTMDEVVYEASGTFDDWAYAVGRFPEIITTCKNVQIKPYPQGMSNALVFLIEMGPQQSKLLGSEDAVYLKVGQKSSQDGYVSRGIRMVSAALQLVSPSLEIKWEDNQAFVTVRGCPSATIKELKALQLSNIGNQPDSNYLFHLEKPIEVEGNVGPDAPKPVVIKFQKEAKDHKTFNLVTIGSFECSKEWLGKGPTFFSTSRTYSANATILGGKVDTLTDKIIGWLGQYSQEQYITFGITVILILVVMSAIFAILQCVFKPPGQGRGEKFEHPQTSEDIENDEEDLHTARGGIVMDM